MNLLFVFVVLTALLSSCLVVSGWQVSLPFLKTTTTRTSWNKATDKKLENAFESVVDSTDFLVPSSPSICLVPMFGDDVQVQFSRRTPDSLLPAEFVLSVNGKDASREDFGWICAKFYESRKFFDDLLDTSELRQVVANHYNHQPPEAGRDASLASMDLSWLFTDESILQELEETGFVVMDNVIETSPEAQQKLSHFLVETTGQDDTVRTDTVHFLSEEDARSCGIEEQYELLMAMASHLNSNLNFPSSPHAPMFPGTKEKPLTIPVLIQLAEYGHNDFYKAHSDNSLTSEFTKDNERIRRNFRAYTCILYCNDDWTPQDGGALRIYPGSRNMLTPEKAMQSCDYVDVNPINGRLLIFDSCLVHSVEKVTQNDKVRRALTLWINRPNDSGIRGETFY